MRDLLEFTIDLFVRGGPVMWPLLAVSVLALALAFERFLFWTLTDRPGRDAWIAQLAERIRAGDEPAVRAILSKDSSVYSRAVGVMLGIPPHDALAIELVEQFRTTFDRFSTTLSTIITAAPLLGILGTVTGIIQSFDLLGKSGRMIEIEAVASGIAEALITTAFGLVITLVALFPYMWSRHNADRAIGRIERLAAARNAAPRGPST